MKNSNAVIHKRREWIVDYLSTVGKISADILAKKLNVSPMTARRDLAHLQNQGLVCKTAHGLYSVSENLAAHQNYEVRMQAYPKEKAAIAKVAATFVQSGDTIGIDSSTTGTVFYQALKEKNGLTIITHNVALSTMYWEYENLTLISTGGTIRRNHSSFRGPHTLQAISSYHYNKVFISAFSFDPVLGFCDIEEEVNSKAAYVRHADQSFLLCNSSKFSKKSLPYYNRDIRIDFIITDWHIQPEMLAKLRRMGYNVIIASKKGEALNAREK